MESYDHIPILRPEVLSILKPEHGNRVLDVTLGLGGHATAFLEAIGSEGELVGLDADSQNLEEARAKLSKLAKLPQLSLIHANFGDISSLNLGCFDIIFADLGLSSPHVDDPARGFTYRENVPLDLRFDRSKGKTAAELLESKRAEVIADWLREYGELRQAGRIARELSVARPQTTGQVKAIIEQVSGRFAVKILPLVFQALRIAVNGELQMLDRFLRAIPVLLKPGGRVGIISFHSLEDRRVKQAFRLLCTPEIHPVTGAIARAAQYLPLTKKPIVPSDAEVEANPRSRSAKFRAIRREPVPFVVESEQ
ncbi:MAG TPA: 16S rRNA (cytosine(1402)-N(4))-methyltransferase RsmH [Candidatus Peribacteraceae bacterium]|nr:16S rRNA (cytosine(1402)-N(4))-methyltransferase RsmH [Candidatus Peribacteraceae bacterium]